MTADDAQFQYLDGQLRPSFAALLAEYEALGAAAVRSQPCALDLRYGAAERQRFDFFVAHGEPLGTLLYFHAGYWQSRDKSTFRFIAPAFTGRGLNVALANYPLCPAVSLATVVEAARASVPAIRAHAAALGQPQSPLIASGHSAGGHLAAELALAGGPAASAVDGVIALSGIYELGPLLATSLNDKLRLDARAARAQSPLYRVATGLPPALFIAGGDETPAFIAQSRQMHEAWLRAGNASSFVIGPGADHYSLLQQWTLPDGPLHAQVERLLDQARERFAQRRPA